jgi:hypothetical protein
LGEAPKKFVVPETIVANTTVSFYCKADDCNVEQAIKGVLKDDGPKTVIAMNESNGAAQSTVAVATIALSMVMARLAL